MTAPVCPPAASPRLEPHVAARRTGERFEWLDVLRFVAIFGVMVVHTGFAYPSMGRGWVLALSVGRYGVDLFFAISGFLFAELMIGRRMETWRYLARRTLRIASVYYLAMLLYLYLRPESVGWREVVMNVAFLNPWLAATDRYLVPGGWSICAEIFFYAVGVMALPLLRSARLVFVCWVMALAMAAVAMSFAGDQWVGHEHSPLVSLPTFVGGVICWYFRRVTLARGRALALAAICFAIVMAASLKLIPSPRYLVGAVCVIATWSSVRLFQAPLAAACGRLSYSMYAFHFAVLDWAIVLVIALLPANAPTWQALTMTFALLVSGTLAVAFVANRYVENPVSRLLR